MSNSKKIIAIYENLPSGGARLTYYNTLKFLRKRFTTKVINEPKYKISNLIQYLYLSLILSPKYQKEAISKVKHDILIVYHSWLVKSPSILRYSMKPKIYICHETMREYYDPLHLELQTIQEKFINTLRLPIKFLDRLNMNSSDTVVVANSKRSKIAIDSTYGVNSVVIYPGIDITNYRYNPRIVKANQVICVSSINKYKNQIFLVEVLSKIPINIRPRLMLIGNGYDKHYLKSIQEKSKMLGVKVKILLNVSDRVKITQLLRSKVFLYAPVNEPFGLVVEEALAVGLPIIAYQYGGGYIEVIDSKNGIILDKIDSTLWSDNLRILLSNESMRKQIATYNYRYAQKHFDSELSNKNLHQLILKLL